MRDHLMLVILAGILFGVANCNVKNEKELTQERYKEIISEGRRITQTAQGSLMNVVKSAMRKGGPSYAVKYCNIEATNVVDSLNVLYKCDISRVSAKNRNPENVLGGENDSTVWNSFLKNTSKKDTIVATSEDYIYYKTISISKPACLNCHGVPVSNIDSLTVSLIDSLYPFDKAKNYNYGDLRGMWRIKFNKSVSSE